MTNPRREALMEHEHTQAEVEAAKSALRRKIEEVGHEFDGEMVALSEGGVFRLTNEEMLGSADTAPYENALKDLIAKAGGWIPENLVVKVGPGEPDVFTKVDESVRLD